MDLFQQQLVKASSAPFKSFSTRKPIASGNVKARASVDGRKEDQHQCALVLLSNPGRSIFSWRLSSLFLSLSLSREIQEAIENAGVCSSTQFQQPTRLGSCTDGGHFYFGFTPKMSILTSLFIFFLSCFLVSSSFSHLLPNPWVVQLFFKRFYFGY